MFLQEGLRNGITSACVYCTVHPQSVDALFEEAEKLGMRLAAGKVLMDRNAPAELLDTPRTGYDQSKALIAKWHNRGRLMYAVTPRFAPTSSREQLEAAGALCKEHPACYLQTHISENRGEIAWVKSCSPSGRTISTSTITMRSAGRARSSAMASTLPTTRWMSCTRPARRSHTARRPISSLAAGSSISSVRCAAIVRCGPGSAPMSAAAHRFQFSRP